MLSYTFRGYQLVIAFVTVASSHRGVVILFAVYHLPLSTMVRRHISTELKEKALSMSHNGMPDAEIREQTGISERSLKRLRSVFRKFGRVVPPPPIDLGRPRVLSSIHVKVRTQRLRPGFHISPDSVSLRLR